MSKVIGAICLGAGIVLLVWGHNVSQSVNSQVKNLFTGSPADKAMYLYIGGGVLLAVGIVQLTIKRK
jgi:nitrate reductase gamma subunit